MREILFRGKRKTGEWIEGSLVVSNGPVNAGRCYILPKFSDIRHGYGYEMGDKIGGFYEVVPETVGQFTGEMDSNAVHIFEGDIVIVSHAAYNFPLVVKWNCGFELWNKETYIDLIDKYSAPTCTVIGNIHDNPELLEGGGDA